MVYGLDLKILNQDFSRENANLYDCNPDNGIHHKRRSHVIVFFQNILSIKYWKLTQFDKLHLWV